MKTTDKILGMIPTTDDVIYVSAEGMIEERIGIVYVQREGEEYTTTRFINKKGYIDYLIDDSEFESILGKKGDTLTLRQLSVAFQNAEDPCEVIDNAEKYFNVIKEGLPDTLKFSFDTSVCGKYHARMDILTREFPYTALSFFDLSEDNYRIKGEGYYHRSLDSVLIPILHAYAQIIGKRPKLEIYITKEDSPLLSPEKLANSRKEIEHQEEMFLPRLRRYINEKLDEEMAREDKRAKENEEFRKKMDVIREGSLTKYDKDPNLY